MKEFLNLLTVGVLPLWGREPMSYDFNGIKIHTLYNIYRFILTYRKTLK